MIELVADKILVSGPTIDGSWKVVLVVGEYMKDRVSQVVQLPSDQNYKIVIEEYKDAGR